MFYPNQCYKWSQTSLYVTQKVFFFSIYEPYCGLWGEFSSRHGIYGPIATAGLRSHTESMALSPQEEFDTRHSDAKMVSQPFKLLQNHAAWL